MKRGNCKFFNGFQNDACEAGIKYIDLAGGVSYAIALRLPCIGTGTFPERAKSEGIPRVECASRCEPSEEEVTAYENAMTQAIKRITSAIPWIEEKVKQFPEGTSVQTDKCPACGGVIRFSIARSNLHMRAHCETVGCLSFIQ